MMTARKRETEPGLRPTSLSGLRTIERRYIVREDLIPLSYPVPPNVNGLDTDAAHDRVSDYLSELERSP